MTPLGKRGATIATILHALLIGGPSLPGQESPAPRPILAPATALAFSPNGALLAQNGRKEIILRSVTAGKFSMEKKARSLPSTLAKITALAFSPRNPALLAAAGGAPGISGGVELFDLEQGAAVGALPLAKDELTALSFDPDGERLAAAGYDRSAAILRIGDRAGGTGRELVITRRLEGHSGPVLAAAWSPGGSIVVTAGADRTLRVWEPETGKLVRSLPFHTEAVNALAFRPPAPAREAPGTPSPLLCASASDDQTVRVWQPAIGRMVRIVRGFDGAVLALAWSPGGARLHAAGKEGIIRTIDGESDQILKSWKGSEEWIEALAVSPAGDTLASGDATGVVRLWRVE